MISRFAFNSFKHVNPGARVRFTYIVLVPLAFVFIFLHLPISLLVMFGVLCPVGADAVDVSQTAPAQSRGRAATHE